MNIAVRNARRTDMDFVRELALDSVLHGVPYGRDISNSEITARVSQELKDLCPGEKTIVLIASDASTDVSLGYLILELDHTEGATGEEQSYIKDLAVLPQHRGSLAVKRLVEEASKRTARAGLRYMVGDVSAHNDRTYLQALRLGFELERFQIAMACSENGPEPMPGRAETEKHYQVSRGRRRSSKRVPGTWKEVREQRAKGKES